MRKGRPLTVGESVLRICRHLTFVEWTSLPPKERLRTPPDSLVSADIKQKAEDVTIIEAEVDAPDAKPKVVQGRAKKVGLNVVTGARKEEANGP